MSHLKFICCEVESAGAYTNAYLVVDTQQKTALVIDPAGNAPKIEAQLAVFEAKPAAILLTHAHLDHIGAAKEFKETYHIPIYLGAGDEALLSLSISLLNEIGEKAEPIAVDHWIQSEGPLSVGGFIVSAIPTPGHSKGSVCFYFPEEAVLFCGDTLFRESIGRTDFTPDFPMPEMQGDFSVLMNSLHHLLAILPDDTAVYTGHGPATTIGYERTHNPFLSQ